MSSPIRATSRATPSSPAAASSTSGLATSGSDPRLQAAPASRRGRGLRRLGFDVPGGDFPNIPYPYAEQVAGLVRLGLGGPWLRAVCWENAARLFGLSAESS
jgi:hypothetical protein